MEIRVQTLHPTSLADDQVLEFPHKAYPDPKGIGQALHRQTPGAELLITEPFDTIRIHEGREQGA